MTKTNHDLIKQGIDKGYRDLLFSLEDTPDRLLELIAPHLLIKKIKTIENPLTSFTNTGIYFFELESNTLEDTIFENTDTRFTLSVTNKETECLQVLSITKITEDDLHSVSDYRRVGSMVDGTMTWTDWYHTVIHWDSIVGIPYALQNWITSQEQKESVLTAEEKALIEQLRTGIDTLNTELSEAEVSLSNQIKEKITERLQLYRPDTSVLPVATQTDKGILSFNDLPFANNLVKGIVLINPVENAMEEYKVPSSKSVYLAIKDLKDWVIAQNYTATSDLTNLANQLPNYALPIQISQNQNNEGVRASDIYFGLTRLADSIEAGSKNVVTSDLLNSYKTTIESRINSIDVEYSGFKLLYTTKLASLEAVVDDLVQFKITPQTVTWESILNKPTDIQFEEEKVNIRKPVTIDGYPVVTEGTIGEKIPNATITVAGKVTLAASLSETSEKVITANLIKPELDDQKTKINSIEAVLDGLRNVLVNKANSTHKHTLSEISDYFDITKRPIYPKMMSALDYLMGKKVFITNNENTDNNELIVNIKEQLFGFGHLEAKTKKIEYLTERFSYAFDALKELFSVSKATSLDSIKFKEIRYFDKLIKDFTSDEKNPTMDKTLGKIFCSEDGEYYFYKSFNHYRIDQFYTLTINRADNTFTCKFNTDVLNQFFEPFILIHSERFGEVVFTSKKIENEPMCVNKYLPLDGRSFRLKKNEYFTWQANGKRYPLIEYLHTEATYEDDETRKNYFVNELNEFNIKLERNQEKYIKENSTDNLLFLITSTSSSVFIISVPDLRIKAGINEDAMITPYLIVS